MKAALREHQGYRFAIATIANGAKPHAVEAELWYLAPGEEEEPSSTILLGRWRYFRRCVAESGAEAVQRVEADFKVGGQAARNPLTGWHGVHAQVTERLSRARWGAASQSTHDH
jgi:hypothetical protein